MRWRYETLRAIDILGGVHRRIDRNYNLYRGDNEVTNIIQFPQLPDLPTIALAMYGVTCTCSFVDPNPIYVEYYYDI